MRSALIYPTILICVAVASVMVLLVFVVPQFQSDVRAGGQGAAAADAGRHRRRHVPAQLVVGGAAGRRCSSCCGFAGAAAMPAVRRARDARLLRMPLLGDLIAKVEIARFARTLATLLANGVTLLAGLASSRRRWATSCSSSALDGVIAKLREGKGFGRPLAETGLYPRLATQMILVGEESGRLEEMLARVADVYDREVADGDQALPGGARARADPGAGRDGGRHRVLDPAGRHGHERTRRLMRV